MPEKITTGLQAALEQAEAEGQPVAEIAEAASQGAEITAEMTVIGHICRKMISIIFAVLRDNTPYVPAVISD